MGRLTEYFGESNSGRSAFTTARAGDRNGDVEVIGAQELSDAIGSIMTTDPDMAGLVRKLIRKLLREARNNLSRDARSYLDSDPRHAAKAVKYAVYKQMFGGNLSILQKRAGSAGSRYELVRQRKVEQNPTMRGGNRRPRIDDDLKKGKRWFEWIKQHCKFDQLIWEHNDKGSYWVHVSYCADGQNRQQVIDNLLKK